MKPADKSRAWKACQAVDRVESCRCLLHVHGFISEAENLKVRTRIEKWCSEHFENETTEPTPERTLPNGP